MSKNLKYFSLAGVILILSIFAAASGYKRGVYIGDCCRSLLIRAFNLYEKPERGISVINGDKYRRYNMTYRQVPDGLFHFGDFLLYKAPKNIKVHDLAETIIELTDYYKIYEAGGAIAECNRITGNIINAGEVAVIKNSLPFFTPDYGRNRTGNIKFTRGLYYSGDNAGGNKFIESLPYLKSMGINAVVFDVKDITGIVQTRSRVEEVKEFGLNRNGAINNLPKLVRECGKNGIYLIARISVFRDHLLYEMDKSSRIRSKSTGRDWNPGAKEMWCDPTSSKVQDYNIALAVELAKAGVDEIQFDYIRFPTLGDQEDAAFEYSTGKKERIDIIAEFLKKAHRKIAEQGAFLSIDIFGVTGWGKDVDTKKLGQQIDMLAANCDVISPMLYPSHFSDNFDGYAKPGDHPYYFIQIGCKKVMELAGKKAYVRPWLQAFAWRTSLYNASYILEQVKASDDSGAYGYLFWNASNKYSEVFQAMEIIGKGR